MFYRNLKNILENVESTPTAPETVKDGALTAEEQNIVDDTVPEVMPVLVADEISNDQVSNEEKVFVESMAKLDSFLKSNKLLSESFSPAAVKNNVIRKNAIAMNERLENIFILRLAESAGDESYQKLKSADRVKRTEFAKMKKKHGARAKAMAESARAKLEIGRIQTVISQEKERILNKK